MDKYAICKEMNDCLMHMMILRREIADIKASVANGTATAFNIREQIHCRGASILRYQLIRDRIVSDTAGKCMYIKKDGSYFVLLLPTPQDCMRCQIEEGFEEVEYKEIPILESTRMKWISSMDQFDISIDRNTY